MNNLILVNKTEDLNKEYVPNDMIICDSNENNFHKYYDPSLKPMLKKEVYDKFQILHDDALKVGYDIIVDSGYRSYEYQSIIWKINLCNHYKDFKNLYPKMKDYEIIKEAEELTNKTVALPGHSEHQTGLALDFAIMRDKVFISYILGTPESEWMLENAYKYGFILRYPKGKEDITGYNYEEWHYRYVGLPYSIEMFNDNLTLEEYHNLVLKRKK